VVLCGLFVYFSTLSSPADVVNFPTPLPQPTVNPTETQPAAMQPTAAIVLVPPRVEAYEPNSNVQYPSLESLADDTGNVTILPNQPTVLEIHWCAKGESSLSQMTSVLDLTVLINGSEVPVSSFNLSKYQTTLEITKEKKDPAVCNMLTGLVRNWDEGVYAVQLSLQATSAYNDGWKDHPADEKQEFIYHVAAASSSTPLEWGRCQLFENLKPDLVFLEPKPDQPLGFYFKFENGVPGLERGIDGDSGDWKYTAAIDTTVSDAICTFDKGYPGRLYCKVQSSSAYTQSVRPVSLSVNGCSWPVYLSDTEIP
jgi:hypothetical protein